jgi:hypothetical protein
VNVLSYFEIFEHPISLSELEQLIGINETDLIVILDDFVSKQIIYSDGIYFSTSIEISKRIASRLNQEKLAASYLKKMPRYIRLMSCFPFVRGVGISGSLSKGVVSEDGDVDYFIITAVDRLWICRSIMVFFKKVILFNSRKYFCVNYFIDLNNLKIQEENMFTAIEISHLVPVIGSGVLQKFKLENNWTTEFVANPELKIEKEPIKRNSFMQNLHELPFKFRIGNWLDLKLMKITVNNWNKKFPEFDKEKFNLTMKSERGVSKHHPRDFQSIVLKKLEENIELVKQRT